MGEVLRSVAAHLDYYDRRWREYCAIVDEAQKSEAAHSSTEFAAHYRQHRRNMETLLDHYAKRWEYYKKLFDAEQQKARWEEERAAAFAARRERGYIYEQERRAQEAADKEHAEPAVKAAAEAVEALRAKLGTPSDRTERFQHYVAMSLAAASAIPGLKGSDLRVVAATVVAPLKVYGCLEQFAFEEAVRRLDPAYNCTNDSQLQGCIEARIAAVASGDLVAILAAWEAENVAARAAMNERIKQLLLSAARA